MVLGRSIRRLEDRPLLTGQGRFAADIGFPGQLHMRVVRSPVAFGRLRAIEVDEALAMAGVAAVWTGRDVATIPPIDFRQVRVPGLEPYRQPILAQDLVRYVGEPLAVVLADDPYLAEDAAELVFADIEELEPCLDATGEPAAFLPGLSSEAAIVEKAYGELEDAFAAAHAIVELRLAVGRHSGVPLETRGAIARYDPARGLLELHGAAKIPHINRRAIAGMLALPLERIHLYEGHVGGGFGIRGELYPEDVLVCLAALRLQRPVKWIEDRREHLLAANHARDQVHQIRAAVDARGFVLGLDDEFWTDQGGYIRTHAATVTDLAAAILPGPYFVPTFRSRGHIRLTNKTPCGTYRAPGRFEGTFVRERLLDAIATRLGLDPLEVRRVNLIGPEAMPFARRIDALGTEVVYDSGDYRRLLDRLLARIGHADLERQLALRRSRGDKVGFGLAMFVEKSGLGPFDDAKVLLGADGGVEVVTGAASVGQGIETALAQICAEALGIQPEGIRVTHGRTDRIEDGMGAFASRATVMTGSAVHLAATLLRRRLLEAAGRLLQAAPEDLTIEDGRIRRADAGASLGIADVARELALQTGVGQADPGRAEPVPPLPGQTRPPQTDAEQSAAGRAEPAQVAPAEKGSGQIRPRQPEAEPSGAGPVDQGQAGSATAGAGQTHRRRPEAEPSGAGPVDQGQAGTARVGAGQTHRRRPEAEPSGVGRADQGQAGTARVGAGQTHPWRTEAEPSGAGRAEPGRTAPSEKGADRIGADATEACQGGIISPVGVVLSADARFTAAHMTYPYGITAAVVRVDPETGGVAIERLWVAYDVGRAVNPMLIEAQIAGGALQGIGGALLEEFLYDRGGQPLAASFADYLMPGLGDAPPIDVLLTEEAPSPLNPLGVKGAGEGGINAVGAAIAAAIDAALAMPGAVDRLPVTSERLYRLARRHGTKSGVEAPVEENPAC